MYLRKRLWVITFLALRVISPGSSYAEPSVDETAQWLTQKLTNLSGTWGTIHRCRSTTYRSSLTKSVKSFSVSNGEVRVTFQMTAYDLDNGNQVMPARQWTMRLKDLYAKSTVKKIDIGPSSSSRLCDAAEHTLPYEVSMSGSNKAGLNFWVDDEDLARRIGKALEHLVKMSGGKEELF